MKCPKCGYVRQPADEAPDYECPSCGVVYAKFQAAAAKVALDLEKKPAPPSTPDVKGKTAACEDCGGVVSWKAKGCVHCGRPFGPDEPAPVAVVDLRMDFLSMVVFMVKWAIAVIPAAIILMVVLTVVFVVLSGAVAG